MNCLTEEQMLEMLDGGIAPNRAEGLANHVAGCATCKAAMTDLATFVDDMRAPVDADVDAHVQAVMKRLSEPRARVDGALDARRKWLAKGLGIAAAVAVAAALAVGVRARPGN